MTEQEWGRVLEEMLLMWPDRDPWPIEATRRSYRQLHNMETRSVMQALHRLRGPHPPSPAMLELEVSKVVADGYRNRSDTEPSKDCGHPAPWTDFGDIWRCRYCPFEWEAGTRPGASNVVA